MYYNTAYRDFSRKISKKKSVIFEITISPISISKFSILNVYVCVHVFKGIIYLKE